MRDILKARCMRCNTTFKPKVKGTPWKNYDSPRYAYLINCPTCRRGYIYDPLEPEKGWFSDRELRVMVTSESTLPSAKTLWDARLRR